MTRNLLTLNRFYLAAAALLFVAEVLIALFIRDQFVRPYLGDVLVVVLIYCAVMSIFRLPGNTVALSVLVFSFAVETLQYIHIVEKLGLEDSPFARTVIGTTFAWTDLISYSAGILIVLWFERYHSVTVARPSAGSTANHPVNSTSTGSDLHEKSFHQ